MVRKTLNEYKWHPERDFSEIVVYYIDRLTPQGYATIKGDEIKDLGEKFMFTQNGMIPYHRVIKIEYKGKIVWQRSQPNSLSI